MKLVDIPVGAVGDAPHEGLPRGFELRKPEPALQLFAGREGPISRKHFLKLCHHGANDAEVQVLGRVLRTRSQDRALPDVHPACESDTPVDHQNLAMVPQVEVRERSRQQRGQKLRHGHASFLQDTMDARTCVARSNVVDQYANFNAAHACLC